MDELLAQFLIEGRDLVAQAQADLELLAMGEHGNAVHSAFRAVHTLKGSVAIFDMVPAERVLHAAEEILEQARKPGASLDAAAVALLVACIDQTDRWIDTLERDGAIGADAGAIADRLLAGTSPLAAAPEPLSEAAAVPWLDALLARAERVVASASGPLIAFRYTPDPECFFRGDDPLAIAAAVPDLVALDIMPAGTWPTLDDWDPFRCAALIEGLSAASGEAVRLAFRLVPDQISIVPVAARAASDETGGGSAGPRTLRVDGERVDALADGIGELIVATNTLSHVAELADRIDARLATRIRAAQGDIERVAGGLHRSVRAIRLVPLAPMLRRLPRMVREVAAAAGKPVRFALEGESLEVDKQIVDGLFEPLLHLIRNAVDHGIEGEDVRNAAGKPPEGQLVLSAKREGEEVLLALSDDGAGIDADRIRATAVARGLVSADAAAALTEQAALGLIFAPGFSTASSIGDLSGRGVGMNAVQSAVERLRGRIEIDTRPGHGTCFRLRLPLDAITTRLLIVQAGTDRYGVRMDQIVETVRVPANRLVPLGQGVACVLRERTVPVLDLAELVGGEPQRRDTVRLVVTESAGDRVALSIDGFGQRVDALVREKSGMLAGLAGVAGTTLLGDGEVLLVLDLPELVA